MNHIEQSSVEENVDWLLFGFGAFLLLLVVATIVIFPDWSAITIDRLYQNITSRLGWLYVLIAITLLIFLLSVAVS